MISSSVNVKVEDILQRLIRQLSFQAEEITIAYHPLLLLIMDYTSYGFRDLLGIFFCTIKLITPVIRNFP